MKFYIISLASDPCQLPLGLFKTLRECAEYMGISYDYLKRCSCGHNGIYATREYLVELVKIDEE